MLTKQEFLEAIATFQKQSDLDDNFHIHMSAAFPGFHAPINEEVLWGLSIRLLEKLMDDPYEYIDWWVWETHFGKDHPNVYWDAPDSTTEKEWNLTTPEALYDFLVENAQRPQPEKDVASPQNQKTLINPDSTTYVTPTRKLTKSYVISSSTSVSKKSSASTCHSTNGMRNKKRRETNV